MRTSATSWVSALFALHRFILLFVVPHRQRRHIRLMLVSSNHSLATFIVQCRQLIHELLLSVQALGRRVSHDSIIIVEHRVDGEGPGPDATDPKHILEGYRLLVALAHCIRGLFLQPVYRPDPSHQPVGDIHEHRGGEQERPYAKERHGSDQVDHDHVERAVIVGAEEVVPPE